MTPKLVDKETEDVVKVLDNANDCLKFLGYNFSEKHFIIESGITNYQKRKQDFKVKGQRISLLKRKKELRETKKEGGVKEMWYRVRMVTKKKERNKKGF